MGALLEKCKEIFFLEIAVNIHLLISMPILIMRL